jgi:hypothetical protein
VAAPTPAPQAVPPEPAAEAPKRKKKSPAKEATEAPSEEKEEPPAEAPVVIPPAADGSSPDVDVEMLRRSWKVLLDHLWAAHEPVLKANLEIATPVSWDGSILELAFPPERRFGVAKVEAKQTELQAALQELFGISPRIKCIVREPVAGPPTVDDDDPPLSEDEVIARMRAELGASDIPSAPEGS